ncbi:hypothetical protein HQN88_14915 [Paenibacillus qinlingensis]|nr:hypothetical protein [Paenibacillus qinlingensis]
MALFFVVSILGVQNAIASIISLQSSRVRHHYPVICQHPPIALSPILRHPSQHHPIALSPISRHPSQHHPIALSPILRHPSQHPPIALSPISLHLSQPPIALSPISLFTSASPRLPSHPIPPEHSVTLATTLVIKWIFSSYLYSILPFTTNNWISYS